MLENPWDTNFGAEKPWDTGFCTGKTLGHWILVPENLGHSFLVPGNLGHRILVAEILGHPGTPGGRTPGLEPLPLPYPPIPSQPSVHSPTRLTGATISDTCRHNSLSEVEVLPWLCCTSTVAAVHYTCSHNHSMGLMPALPGTQTGTQNRGPNSVAQRSEIQICDQIGKPIDILEKYLMSILYPSCRPKM